MRQAYQQIAYLWYEVTRMNNRRWWRWISCWFTSSFWAIASYRLDRFFFLVFGRYWPPMRVFLSPLFFLTRPWFGQGHCEIHYRANIGRGLRVLHPALGVVVTAATIAGDNLILAGGNCIGARRTLKEGDILIGSNVSLGINAVILGPIRLGNNIEISPGAIIVKDAEDGQTLIAPPAHYLQKNTSQASH